jgi:hypothetical protein
MAVESLKTALVLMLQTRCASTHRVSLLKVDSILDKPVQDGMTFHLNHALTRNFWHGSGRSLAQLQVMLDIRDEDH